MDLLSQASLDTDIQPGSTVFVAQVVDTIVWDVIDVDLIVWDVEDVH